ncbi:phospholipase A1 member A [Discoglossus pictus]
MAGSMRGSRELLLVTLLLMFISSSGAQVERPPIEHCPDFRTAGIFKGSSLHVQFLLYTPHNPTCGQVIHGNGTHNVEISNFNASLGTKIVIHGFRALGTKPSWITNLVSSLIGAAEVNVVAVDWVYGSTAQYHHAVDNVPKISLEVATLISSLLYVGATEESMHLIGVSLGAHVAGLVGQFFGGRLGRITGLDPAGYKFTRASPEERLDPGDAIFVEAIHTDTDNFGIRIPVGHVDFFINGGRDQPGCPSVRHLYSYMICDHMRSVNMYINAVQGICTFTGYPCSSYEDFRNGQCLDCTDSQFSSCPHIGLKNVTVNSGKGFQPKEIQLFLMTTHTEPFCGHHILLEFTLTESRNSSTTIDIQLKSDQSTSKAKINIPRSSQQGKVVTVLEVPLCQFHTVILRLPSSISSLWKRKPEISGKLCVVELPMRDRSEMVCLSQTLTLSGSGLTQDLATVCR